jgi:riboflavin kinase/FMN adenylyltransferase
MQIIKTLSEVKKERIGLTIGNFDGLHLGHQQLISEVKKRCLADNLKTAVMTFVPHPLVVLQAKTGFLLNTYEEKRELFKSQGVDYLIEINFNRDFSTQSAESFINDIVLGSGNIGHLFLGYDFTFGANKSGDYELARSLCAGQRVEVTSLDGLLSGEEPISSTAIREALSAGKIESAHKLLGRNYSLSGRIIKGAGRGKLIGFPTANLSYDPVRLVPAKGVYSTLTHVSDMVFKSVTNIGVNPTFDGTDLSVETHILDFDRDIYGEKISVEFLLRLRDEQKFSDVNELIDQIKKDIDQRRNCI